MDVRKIDTFGEVAAEDDTILEYFLTTETVARIKQGAHLVILGTKGSGKTALVRHFSEQEHKGLISNAIRMTQYPWGVHAQRKDAGAGETEAYIASWEYLLAVEYAKAVARACAYEEDDGLRRIRRFLKDNYGTEDADSKELLRPDELKLSASLEPQIFGAKLFKLEFGRRPNDTKLGAELHAVSESLFVNAEQSAARYLSDKLILLHVDELDYGLASLDASRSHMLTGLILAALSVFRRFQKSAVRFCPIVYLRSDLWTALHFAEKNKIRQTYTHEILWSEDELKKMIEARAAKKLGQKVLFEELEDGETVRGKQRKWNHIVARTKRRPRDVIQFMNSILDCAKARWTEPPRITNKDVTTGRESYSAYFKGEFDDEIRPHWADWDDPMDAIASMTKVAFELGEFKSAYEAHRKPDGPHATEALERLFQFSVVAYKQPRGGGGSRWVFRYADPGARWDPGANTFKVHPGLKEFYKLREERFSLDKALDAYEDIPDEDELL